MNPGDETLRAIEEAKARPFGVSAPSRAKAFGNPDSIARTRALPLRAFQPGPLHWLLAGTHVGGAVSVAVLPTLWPWAAGAMLTSHALNLAFGLLPASTALGPVISHLPPEAASRGEIALTFDDGPDAEVTPHVLDLLDAADARATFFCVGSRACTQPKLLHEIVDRGHTVENHAFSHSTMFGFYGVRRLVRDIGDAQHALTDITGVAPRFFRAPFGIRTPLTEPALARLGLSCVAWSIRSLDSVDGDATRVAARITRRLKPAAIVLMHDGSEVRERPAEPSVLDALPIVLRNTRQRGFRCVTLRSALPT